MAKTKSRTTAQGTNWGRILTIGVAAVFVVWFSAFLIGPTLQDLFGRALQPASTFSAPASAPALPQSNSAQPSNPNAPLSPNFSIKTVDGQTVSLAKEKGRVLGIFFMAAWCSSCAGEANAWAQVYAKYREKGLDVLIVDVDQSETEKDLLGFKTRWQGGNHWWALDKDSTLVKTFRVQSLDTTYIIGRDGRVTYYDYWPTPVDVLEREVLKVLQ